MTKLVYNFLRQRCCSIHTSYQVNMYKGYKCFRPSMFIFCSHMIHVYQICSPGLEVFVSNVQLFFSTNQLNHLSTTKRSHQRILSTCKHNPVLRCRLAPLCPITASQSLSSHHVSTTHSFLQDYQHKHWQGVA